MATTGYMGTKSGNRGASSSLWGSCPWDAIAAGKEDGRLFYDDFLNFGTLTAGGTLTTGPWTMVADTGGTITASTGDANGVIAMVTDTTDEDEIYLMGSNNLFGTWVLPASDGNDLWFEARLKVSTVTNGELGLFVGLSEEAMAADSIVDATGAMVSKDLVGFHVAAASGTSANWVYRKASQTQQTALAAAATLAADTYIKLGFAVHYRNPSDRVMECYVNGEMKSTFVTKASMSASTFPAGEELLPFIGMKSMTGAAKTVSVDWIRIAQRG